MTKTYTTNIEKGGVGKTTLTYNGAFYLANKKDNKVLLIDMDKSCNLTNRFKNFLPEIIHPENTVEEFFTRTQNPIPVTVTENIDLICGYSDLATLSKDVEAGKGKGYLLSWYYSNIDKIEEKYDYMLIDTHNDLGIFTDNAIAMSDYVIAIADIDEDAIEKINLEADHIEKLKNDFVNPMTGESFVNAQLIKIGNKVQSNTSDSHAFRKAFEQMMKVDNHFLGYFEFRTLFAKAKTTGQSLVELESDYNSLSYKKFFEETWNLYEKIYTFGD